MAGLGMTQHDTLATVLVGRRRLQFQPLVAAYGIDWTLSLIHAYNDAFAYRSHETKLKVGQVLIRFFRFISEERIEGIPDEQIKISFNKLKSNQSVANEKQIALSATRNFVSKVNDRHDFTIVRTAVRKTRISVVEAFQDGWSKLARVGFLPVLDSFPRLSADPYGETRLGRSLGELTAEGQKPPPPERVNELSRLRLQRLRDLCVEHLEAAYKAYRRGVELLAEPHRIEIRDILELSGGSSRYPADRRDEYDAVFNRCFPIDEHAEQEKNLLRYYNHLGSMPPFKSPNGERHPFEKSKTAFAPTFMEISEEDASCCAGKPHQGNGRRIADRHAQAPQTRRLGC